MDFVACGALKGCCLACLCLAALAAAGQGLANVSNCSKPTFIDKTGAVALRVPFDDASPFHGGLAPVIRYEIAGARAGYIDRTGKVVWEPSR